MEEKKQEISAYLRNVVNPFLQPMVQQMALQRPSDVVAFIHQYVLKHMNNKKEQKHNESQKHNGSGTQSQSEDQQVKKKILKKLQQKKKNKDKLDKKVSRQGISAEVFGKYNQKKAFVPKVIKKSSDIQEKIRSLINKSILFTNLNEQDKQIIIDAMQEFQTVPDQFIIKQGQIGGDMLYIVGDGQFHCIRVMQGVKPYQKTYQPGQFFGELALMYNAPRAATIKSIGKGILFGLDRNTFINVVQESATKKRKSNLDVLSKVQILGQIDPYEKEQICDVLKQESYNAGDYIVKQGQQGNRFYIIAEGKLIAEKNENGKCKRVFEYKQGDYFGEIALIRDTVRQASVKAQTNCKIVYIEREAFKRLLGPIEDILKRNEQKYKLYVAKQNEKQK